MGQNAYIEDEGGESSDDEITSTFHLEKTKIVNLEDIQTKSINILPGGEININNKIKGLTSGTDNTDAVNFNQLNSEITRAKAVELELSNEIKNIKDGDIDFNKDLDDEIDRAKAAELENKTDIENEISRSTVADGELTSKISTEETRAKNAENVLSQSIIENSSEVDAITATQVILTADVVSMKKTISDNKTEISSLNLTIDTLSGKLDDLCENLFNKKSPKFKKRKKHK